MYWNSQGIYSKKAKLSELRQLVNTYSPDILTIAEPMLSNRQPPALKGYNKIVSLRENTKAGGLIMYFKKHLPISTNYTIECSIENICIKINDKLLIAAYCQASQLNYHDLLTLMASENKSIIFGDLNARHKDWNNTFDNTNGKRLKSALQNTNLVLFNTPTPTCFTNIDNPSYIDIVISHNIFVNNLIAQNELESDHTPITFELPHTPTEPQPPRHIRKDYDKANWSQYKHFLNQNITINRNIQTTQDIDNEIQNITQNIQQAINTYIPDIEPKTTPLPQHIQDQIKHKNRLRRIYQKQPTQQNKTNLTNQIALVSDILTIYDREKWDKRIQAATNKRGNVWKEIKQVKNQSLSMPPLHENNETITNTEIKTNIIANHLEQTHRLTQNLSDQRTTQHVQNTIQDFIEQHPTPTQQITTSPTEINRIIRKQRPYSAPGHDKIQIKALRHLPKKAIVQLFYIYQTCLKLAYFPTTWKKAIIIPILKKHKNPNLASSYRPISLLSALGKILERIIIKEVQYTLFENDTIIPEQFGFRQAHTTTMQIARLANKISLNYNIKHTTSIAYLDLEKAFDVVWHQALIYKLISNNFPNAITHIIISYLKDRTFKVKIDDKHSYERQIPAGVPQGGVLSSTLFLIYVNDIPKDNNTKLALFADDTAIIAQSRQTRQANIYLNTHLQTLDNYFTKWKLQINPQKTSIVNYNKKLNFEDEQIVTLQNTPIPTLQTTKYLGLQLDRKLNFKKHIQEITTKARLILKYIYPFIIHSSKLTQKQKINLYTAYMLPTLLYACPVFVSAPNYILRPIASMETRTLRIILGKKLTEITNSELYRETGLIPILRKMYNLSRRFYNETVNASTLTMGMGQTHAGNLPFKITHRLIHQRIIDLDPNT